MGCVLKVVEKLNEHELREDKEEAQMLCPFFVHCVQPKGAREQI